MSNPKADAELAKAIEDRTIPVADPPAQVQTTEIKEVKEPETLHEDAHGLSQNVEDFEIDVPPPEGI